MDDPMDRDKFPNRPDHGDFWRLSELVNKIDGQATEGQVHPMTIASEFVDPASIEYLILNRSGMFCQQLGLPSAARPALAAALLDGFVLGAAFQRVKSSEPHEPTGRHASPQAWRRLRAALGAAEGKDIAADIAAVVGCDVQLVDTALNDMPWDRKKQL